MGKKLDADRAIVAVGFVVLIIAGAWHLSRPDAAPSVITTTQEEISFEALAAGIQVSPQTLLDTPPVMYDPVESHARLARSYVLPQTETELRELLGQTELPASRISELVSLARPGVALVPRGTRPDSTSGGSTYVGGYPMLPATYPWPTQDGERLSLVAQFDLDALDDDVFPWLPPTGLLQFYLPLFEDYHFEPFEGDGFVLWFEDSTGFVHRTDGRAAWGDYAFELDHVRFLSLPSRYSSFHLRQWSEQERDAYEWYPGQTSVTDQLGGWSGEFQGDPLFAAAINKSGRTYEELTELIPAEATWPEGHDVYDMYATEVDLSPWVPLLELSLTPSVDGEGMWGDAGEIRWVVRQADAERRDFSDTWWDFVN